MSDHDYELQDFQFWVGSGIYVEETKSAGIRLCFNLIPDVKIVSGLGTKDSPYEFE